MIKRIISFIFAIFTFLFGFESEDSKLIKEQEKNFDKSVVAAEIMDAIENRDIDALEAMMCQNIKDNVENLPEKIGEFIDTLPGEIIKWELDTNPSFSTYEKNGKGKVIQEIEIEAIVYTTVGGPYEVSVIWQFINNYQPEELGIRTFELLDKNPELPVQKCIALIIQTQNATLPS